MPNSFISQSVDADFVRLKSIMDRMAFCNNMVDNSALVNYRQTAGGRLYSELSNLLFHGISGSDSLRSALLYLQGYFLLDQILVYQNDGSGQYILAGKATDQQINAPLVLKRMPGEAVVNITGSWLYECHQSTDDEWSKCAFASAWLFPFSSSNVEQGFVAYGFYSDGRNWHGSDFDLLSVATVLIANHMQLTGCLKQNSDRSGLYEIVNHISTIVSGQSALEFNIDTLMSYAGERIGALRGFVFESDHSQVLNNGYEWVADGEENIKHLFQHPISNDIFSRWQDVFNEARYILTDNRFDVEESTLTENCERRSLLFPLYRNSILHGFLGFEFALKDVPVEGDFAFMAAQLVASMIERLLDRELMGNNEAQLNSKIEDLNHRLDKSEQLVAGIVAAAPIGIVIVQQRRIVFANQQMNSLVSNSGFTLIGSRIEELNNFFRCNDPQQFNELYTTIDACGRTTVQLELTDRAGIKLAFDIHGLQGPMIDGEQSYVLFFQNITEAFTVRKKVEEANLRYQTILDTNPDAVLVFSSPSKRLSYINESATTMLGYSLEELQQISIVKLFAGFSMLKQVWQLIQIINSGSDYKGELEVISRQGSKLTVEMKGVALSLNDEPHYYISMHNITARKLREEQLRASENKYRALIENSSDCMIRMALNGEILFVNAATIHVFGKNDSLPVFSFSDEVLLSLLNHLKMVENTGKVTSFEMEFVSSGQLVVLEWSVIPEYGNSSEVESVLFVGRDFSIRRQTENILKQAIEKAETADKFKSVFLNNLSHEIRTPLNAVVGFSCFLHDEILSQKERDLYVDIIQKNADALMALIDDIVDVAKLESGPLQSIIEPVRINDICRKLENKYGSKISDEKRELDFSCHCGASDALMINSDGHLLLQAVSKLLDNALKFTSSGFISFGYHVQGDDIEFFVKDSGIGIEDEEQGIIFDSFRQCENSNGRRFGGNGVGLYIAQRLVEILGGEISFNSQRHKGSEFYITFSKMAFFTDNVLSQSAVIDNLPESEMLFKNRLIMLAIDDSSERLLIRRYLENSGASIISVRSVYSALQLLTSRNDIDCLFIDYKVLSNNALRMIVTQYKNSNKQGKILLITDDGGVTEREANVDLVLQKPFDKQGLMGCLLKLA